VRTTIDIPDDLLSQAQGVMGTKTKRETVIEALHRVVRDSVWEELLALEGSGIIDLTQEELERMRADD
jgi:Arc/MetJ family transcription regulator